MEIYDGWKLKNCDGGSIHRNYLIFIRGDEIHVTYVLIKGIIYEGALRPAVNG